MVNLTPSEFEGLLRLVNRGRAAQAEVDELLQPKTPAQRKAAQRERARAAGLKRIEIEVHPDIEDQVRRFVARKNTAAADVAMHREVMAVARDSE